MSVYIAGEPHWQRVSQYLGDNNGITIDDTLLSIAHDQFKNPTLVVFTQPNTGHVFPCEHYRIQAITHAGGQSVITLCTDGPFVGMSVSYHVNAPETLWSSYNNHCAAISQFTRVPYTHGSWISPDHYIPVFHTDMVVDYTRLHPFFGHLRDYKQLIATSNDTSS